MRAFVGTQQKLQDPVTDEDNVFPKFSKKVNELENSDSNAVVDGYMDVFRKSKEHHVFSDELISRLQPFLSFRNMLVPTSYASARASYMSSRSALVVGVSSMEPE